MCFERKSEYKGGRMYRYNRHSVTKYSTRLLIKDGVLPERKAE